MSVTVDLVATRIKNRWCGALWLIVSMAILWSMTTAAAMDSPSVGDSSLNSGYHLLYDLSFDRAHQIFVSWSTEHPNDPLGPVSEAAGELFAEFNRLGVLESQFYENDKQFDGRKKMVPDAGLRDRFTAALEQAESRARARLAKNSKDRDALLAMTMSAGLKADYAALIEKSNLTSLHFTRESNSWAEQLLAVDPKCYDAYLATGFSKYIVGSMSAPVRWLVRMGGLAGDKEQGIAELQMTAQHGEFLAPFARILLAIAYVREKDKPHARQILTSLHADFPNNPLFPREMARLDIER